MEHLYKYGCIGEHSEALFSTSQVWFSAPEHLEDPFECRPVFRFEGGRDEIIASLTGWLCRSNPDISEETAEAEAVAIVMQGRHRDPDTWEGLRQDLTRLLGNEIGLYCLARSPDSSPMWSRYGDEHRGYCLEFESTGRAAVFGAAQPVLYSDGYPTIDYFSAPREEQVDRVFLTKHTDWAHEQEWRVVDFQDGPGRREYPAGLLRSVIFGLRMPEPHKALIREWAGRRGGPVRFLQAVRDGQKISVGLRDVS